MNKPSPSTPKQRATPKQPAFKSVAERNMAPRDQTERPVPTDKAALLNKVLAFVIQKAV